MSCQSVSNCFGFGGNCHGSIDNVGAGLSCSLIVGRNQKPAQSASLNYTKLESRQKYRTWLGQKIVEQRLRSDRQMSLGKVTADIRASPGHWMPTRTETTNQTYGKYVDLIPEYPAEYPLPYSTAYPSDKLLIRDGCTTTCHETQSPFLPIPQRRCRVETSETKNYLAGYGSVLRTYGGIPLIEGAAGCFRGSEPIELECNIPFLARKLAKDYGQRKCNHTFPVTARTGLELRRPIYEYSFYGQTAPCWTLN